MNKVTNLKSYSMMLLLAVLNFNASAAEGPLQATDSELSALTAMNAPYNDAFKGSAEDNWVYQLASKNELLPHCYLSKTESIAVGELANYEGTEMTCIQVGDSSRIFWPTRWVDHCKSVGKPIHICMMDEIKR